MTVNSALAIAELRPVSSQDIIGIGALHARVFGPGRFTRTAYRIREGAPKFSRFCRQALIAGELVAAVSFTEIQIGEKRHALLLGPLAVASEVANQGLGRMLIATGLDQAREYGISVVLLVGNQSYYARHGFEQVPIGQIKLPGPVDPHRILAWQAEPDAMRDYEGMVVATRG